MIPPSQTPPIPRAERRLAAAACAAIAALALFCAPALGSPAAAAQQKLTDAGTGAGSGGQLGLAVAVDGDTLVLGDPAGAGGAGVVDVFGRIGDTRVRTARLAASDGSPGDSIGGAVAIDGDTIVGGASGDGPGRNATDQGSLYTFARTGASDRSETAKLTGAAGAAGARLGFSVAIDGDTIVAGAPGLTLGSNARQGAVYTFTRSGDPARPPTAILAAREGGTDQALGSSVAIDGETIVAGAPGDTVSGKAQQGSAYLFATSGAPVRTQTAKLLDPDGVKNAVLGFSVAVDRGTIAAGAPGSQSAMVFFSTKHDPSTKKPGGGTSTPPTGKLSLSKLAVKPRTIHRAASAPRRSAKPRIAFTLSAAATVELRFARAQQGRAVGGTCRKPSHSNRGKPRCIRYVAGGSLTAHGRAGANAIPFTGRLPKHRPLAVDTG
jgi:hypothetical protein